MTALPKRSRPLPKPRKIFGTSYDVDGEVMVYTEKQMAAFGDDCFADGFRACETRFRDALRQLSAQPANTKPHPIQTEEDAWADYRSGRGPRPVRR